MSKILLVGFFCSGTPVFMPVRTNMFIPGRWDVQRKGRQCPAADIWCFFLQELRALQNSLLGTFPVPTEARDSRARASADFDRSISLDALTGGPGPGLGGSDLLRSLSIGGDALGQPSQQGVPAGYNLWSIA
jgi:hypothetical protein